ncbi:MAG: protein jag [Lachnospiraceae bacterium]|nr:protein jag [Lachnospiraceae bacterium]
MEYIEITGKTVDDAITEACQKLEVTSDRLDFEVVEKGSSGFLGFGNKPAMIKARIKTEEKAASDPVQKKEAKSEVKEEKKEEKKEESRKEQEKPAETEKAPEKKESEGPVVIKNDPKEFLNKVFEAMDLKVDIHITQENDELNVELSGDEMGILIGKRGQTLDSLQYLTSLYVNKNSDEYIRVKLDTENYRARRKDTLENLAKNLAYKVKRTKRPVVLEPMNPYERRIIHSALQNDKYVSTHSEGDEPFRKVVITYNR